MPALPKQQLRQLVAVACTDDALRQLLELLAGVPAHSKVYKAMNMLSGQWQELDEQVRLGLLPFKEASPARARINAAVLDYLEQLPDQISASRSKTPAAEVALRRSVQAIAADSVWEYDLFFSFSSKDIEAARDYCYALRGYGLRVFFSADDLRLRGGHNFGDVIDHALRQSRHFLLFCSPNAIQSNWVKLEHNTFFQQYHLPQEDARGFYIAEGPDFHPDLVPTFYRRIQRIQAAEELLHSLAAFAPTEKVPTNPTPPIISIAPSPPTNKPAAAEEHAWEFTTDADTPAAYKKFLARFPQGFYAAKAQARLDAFEADDIAWEFATDQDSEKALQKYLGKYPDGLHAAEARDQIAAFERIREAEAEQKRQAQEEAERQRNEAAAAEKRRAEADALARKQREEQEKADPFHDLMIPIEGGAFKLGDSHPVTLKKFHLCKYPVTQAQWKAVMGVNPSHFKGDDLPVEQVSWDDAQAFLKKLNEKTGQKYRLPSEAEWEYAAKGGNQSKGFEYAGSNDLKEVGWYWENSGDKPLSGDWKIDKITANNCKTHPVGQKKPNELGLYDMSGNVWEWCQDVWHDDYKGAPGDGSAWEQGGDSSRRVVRGGSSIRVIAGPPPASGTTRTTGSTTSVSVSPGNLLTLYTFTLLSFLPFGEAEKFF